MEGEAFEAEKLTLGQSLRFSASQRPLRQLDSLVACGW